MHDAIWIVFNAKGWSIGVFLEVMFRTSLDVGPVDVNIFVSVISTLDMEKSKGMNEFMDDTVWQLLLCLYLALFLVSMTCYT